MKKIFSYTFYLLVITFTFYGCSAASMTPLSNDTTLNKVVEVENMSKEEIFLNSMEWFSTTFNESKSVIDYQDKEAGKIIGNGAISHVYATIVSGQVKFSVKIEIKENRARISLTNFSAKIIGSSGPPVDRAIMQSEYEKAIPKLESLMNDYSAYIKNASSSNSDNW